MTDPLLIEALAAIAEERPRSFDRSFGLAEELIRRSGEADLLHGLLDQIPTECPAEVIADLLGIVSWMVGDDGAAIRRESEGWLSDGSDLRRIRIALNLDVYPFREREEMEQVLGRVAALHPEVAGRCQELIDSRRRERSPRGISAWLRRLRSGTGSSAPSAPRGSPSRP